MSKTLSLVDRLLDRARHLQNLGLNAQARVVLERLASFRSLPKPVAEETQQRLAELLMDADEYPQARRHLAAALTHQPNKPAHHFQMAQAIQEDATCPPETALPHYRAAVRLDPGNAHYLCEFGLLALRLGKTAEGLRLLRQARDVAPDDLQVLDDLATGLAEADLEAEARHLLRTAMFRNSGERSYRELYRRHQFRWLHDEQARRSSIPFPEDEPVLLPFFRPSTRTRKFTIDGQIFRIDAAERNTGPRRSSTPSSRPSKKRGG